MGVALLVFLAGGAAWWFVARQPRGPEEPVTVDAGPVTEPADAGPLLSLDDGDALLKSLAGGWSRHPTFLKWLDAVVVRQLAAATLAVAEGHSPRASVPFLSLTAPFTVREENTGKKKSSPRLFMATESYARYDELVEAFDSIDAAAAGEAWRKLEPFCDVAFAEISRPGTRFHDAVRLAIQRLVAVKVPEGDLELLPKGAVYVFKDPAIESLSDAEKHLIRMGPTHAQRIQQQLRTFAAHAKLDLESPERH